MDRKCQPITDGSLDDGNTKDPAITEKWFSELEGLIEANDGYFYPAMTPYREWADLDFRNLSPL
ncbi:hypothetical protein [Paraflavitalea pollutisoli]|uniref:hypothetical protein n=1 Tax=Paraflavitalea pollutisoli TaxID=3034143 RepID=UPI0023EDE21B|nr:hypothetical protein [Paraflavitalea sp. H1-2-19X]